jgi:hypothetical protein
MLNRMFQKLSHYMHALLTITSSIKGIRRQRSVYLTTNTTISRIHHHIQAAIASKNKQGWANETQTCTRLYTVLEYVVDYTHGKKLSHIKNVIRKTTGEQKPGKDNISG